MPQQHKEANGEGVKLRCYACGRMEANFVHVVLDLECSVILTRMVDKYKQFKKKQALGKKRKADARKLKRHNQAPQQLPAPQPDAKQPNQAEQTADKQGTAAG